MTLIFNASQVMFMLDIIKEDKKRWCKIGDDKDVIREFDGIISSLESALDEYNGMRRALNTLAASAIEKQ